MESATGWSAFWEQASQNLQRGWSWSGFERSAFFVNAGGARFADLAPVLGADQVSDGRGLAAGDIDGDGDLDLVGTCSGTHPHVYVLRNDLENDRHFLFIDLVPRERHSVAGTRLVLEAGGVQQRRDVALGSGFLTQHSTTQHFGLNRASTVAALEITWPDGEASRFTELAADRRIVIHQADNRVEELPLRKHNEGATGRLPEIEWDSLANDLMRVPGPRLGGIPLVDTNGAKHTFDADADPNGPYVLLNLWATWCANCKAEMPALSEAHAEHPDELRILGVSLDEEVETEEVARVASAWEIDYPVVHLTGKPRERFEKRTATLLDKQGGLVLPSSLLVAPDGRVVALARGEVDIDRVKVLLASLRRDRR